MPSGPDILFQPFHLKSLALKNRVVMAPMTRPSARSKAFGFGQAG